MWLTAVYHQVSLFSLKSSDATSTGGRSLLVPTPFSIKMALLDIALRLYGMETGSTYFPLIRDLAIAISPPRHIVVNNCFVRIHKPRRSKGGQGEADSDPGDEGEGRGEGPFIRSVAFREYVQYNGPLGLAVEIRTESDVSALISLLAQVTYLGKRGSLFQLDSPPMQVEQFPVRQGYLPLDGRETSVPAGVASMILQILDDCGPQMTFEQANIYAPKSKNSDITLGKERILRHIVLPYRLTRSSRGFSLYERIAG